MQTIYVKQMQPHRNNTVCASDKKKVILLWVSETYIRNIIEIILFGIGES